MRCLLAALLFALSAQADVYIQAHRGGLDEVPENTMPAFEHAWSVPGAIPEMDLSTTSDGVIVMMHDTTPARTTDAPTPWDKTPMRKIPFAEVAKWDSGVKFAPKYAGTRVPTLDEVFAAMKKDPKREVYFDLKDVDLEQLKTRILGEGVGHQVIFVHGDLAMCAKLKALYPGARTMSWLSGTPERIRARFDALKDEEIQSVSQLQFHLTVKSAGPPIEYALDDEFLRAAVARVKALDVELQLRPFAFDHASLERLVGLGVHWYVADAPAAFHAALSGQPK